MRKFCRYILALAILGLASSSAYANCGPSSLDPANNLSDVCSTTATLGNIGASAANGSTAFTAAGGTASLSPATRSSFALTPQDYGAPADSQRVQVFGVTSTAGSPNITLAISQMTAGYAGANIVIAGMGDGAATAVSSVASGGATNKVGDLLTLSASGCGTFPVLKVTSITGPANPWAAGAAGAVQTAAIWSPGDCAATLASLPSGAVSVSSSTGSDTSATFVITWAARPLATTISTINGGSSYTLAANAVQTLASATKWIAYGHDDAAAINAELSAGATVITLPQLSGRGSYGIYSPIAFPSTTRVIFECQGATITALASMTAMLSDAQSTDFYSNQGTVIDSCRLDGFGQANYNINHNNFMWYFRSNIILNAVVGNVYVAGHGEQTTFAANQYRNDAAVIGYFPQFNVSVNYTDNHFTDEVASGAVDNFVSNSSGNYWTNIHGFFFQESAFVDSGGSAYVTKLYADSAPSYLPGIQLLATFTDVTGWSATSSNTASIGTYVATQNGFNTLTGGIFQGITTLNAVAVGWGSNLSYGGNLNSANYVFSNGKAAYQNMGYGDGSVSLGLAAAAGGGCIAIGSFSGCSFGGAALGSSSTATANGGVALGASAKDNGVTQFVYSPGTSVGSGKNQYAVAVLSATTSGASAVRLTADGAAAGAANCANLSASTSDQAIDVRLIVTDTTSAKQYSAAWTAHLFTRSGAASTTFVDGATSTVSPDGTHSNGAWTGAGSTIAADTTNGCLNVTFTPPTGNTDTLHAVASIAGPQAQ